MVLHYGRDTWYEVGGCMELLFEVVWIKNYFFRVDDMEVTNTSINCMWTCGHPIFRVHMIHLSSMGGGNYVIHYSSSCDIIYIYTYIS